MSRATIFDFDSNTPSHFEEVRRAASGLPWCDTCNRPAVWSQTSGWLHSSVVNQYGVPSYQDQWRHIVTTSEWAKTPSWTDEDFTETPGD